MARLPKPVEAVRLRDTVFHHAQHNFVGHQLATFHQGFCFEPQLGAAADVVAKHIAGR